MIFKRTNDGADALITSAEKYLGYQCRPGNNSIFGQTVGYQGLVWSGAFIDVVAREAGVTVPACMYSASGMSEFISRRAWFTRPQPGDIVFFNFPTDALTGMPHVGLVTKTEAWQTDGLIETIEANVDTGLPKASQGKDGVYRRVRFSFDVIGFGRPAYSLPVSQEQTGVPTIRLGNISPGKRNREIELVQRALVLMTGLHIAKPGSYDGYTLSAYASYQRQIGYLVSDATGIPDLASLQRLGRDSRIFSAQA